MSVLFDIICDCGFWIDMATCVALFVGTNGLASGLRRQCRVAGTVTIFAGFVCKNSFGIITLYLKNSAMVYPSVW